MGKNKINVDTLDANSRRFNSGEAPLPTSIRNERVNMDLSIGTTTPVKVYGEDFLILNPQKGYSDILISCNHVVLMIPYIYNKRKHVFRIDVHGRIKKISERDYKFKILEFWDKNQERIYKDLWDMMDYEPYRVSYLSNEKFLGRI